MAQFYAPNFSGLLPLFDGKSSAGGKLYAYKAGSSVPAPLYSEDGTALGSWVSIDSNGCADFLLSSALTYKLVVKDALGATLGEWDNVSATNAPGMTNPLTAEGSLIVGGTAGEPTELPAGSEGQALKIVSGVPAWATDAEGMQNPMTTEGDLIVGSTDGEPSRLGVGSAGQVLTSDGTTWAPAAIPTQTGDHKVSADGTDTAGYLEDKIGAGSGISLATSAGKVMVSAAAQTGDHKLLTTSADTSAGYLADKLVAGANVTLTTQTDLDGVQTLEIAAAGGGGGGGAQIAFTNGNGWGYIADSSFANNSNGHLYYGLLSPSADCTPRKAYARCRGTSGSYTKNYVGIYERTNGSSYSLVCASDNLTDVPGNSEFKVIEFNFSTTAKIYANKVYMFAWLSDKQWLLSKAMQYYLGGQNKLYSGHFAASSLPASFDASSGTVERFQPYLDILADL